MAFGCTWCFLHIGSRRATVRLSGHVAPELASCLIYRISMPVDPVVCCTCCHFVSVFGIVLCDSDRLPFWDAVPACAHDGCFILVWCCTFHRFDRAGVWRSSHRDNVLETL